MRERGVLAASVLALVLLAHSARADDGPSDGQRIALLSKPAVVRVVSIWQAKYAIPGQEVSIKCGGTGSGFFISPDGYVATNAHVVDFIADEGKGKDMCNENFLRMILKQLPKDKALALLRKSKLTEFTKHAYVVLPNGDHLDYDIKSIGGESGEGGKDCAILKVATHNAPTLPIGDSSKVQLQDKVWAIGYPGVADMANEGYIDEKSELEASITDGAVSALKRTPAGDSVIQMSTPIAHGNSGGPTLNSKGEVIGLATFGDSSNGGGFNFMVTSGTLLEFVRQAGAPAGRGEIDTLWSEALTLYWAGKYTEAIEKLKDVKAMFPAHTEAVKLLDQAYAIRRAQGKDNKDGAKPAVVAAAITPPPAVNPPTDTPPGTVTAAGAIKPDAGVSPVVLVGVGAAGALGLAAVALLLMRKKSAPIPVPPPVVAKSAPAARVVKPVAARSANAGRPVIPATIAVSKTDRDANRTAFVSGRVGSLTCTEGQLKGQRFSLTEEGLLIGRQSGVAHVVVDDERASGEHVWVRWEDGVLVAEDQGSTNGTFVNDVRSGRISRVALEDGDVLIVAEPDCLSLQVKV